MPGQSDTPAQTLRRLAGEPEAQARYALTLLDRRRSRDLLQAALRVLANHPLDEARAPLWALYDYYAESGPVRDPGCYLRTALLAALRPLARSDDLPLLLAAVDTYEYLPPDFNEEAILLRAAGLVMLNELDDTLARYHAARLLGDGLSDPMSGEPALTAARVLATQEELAPLYFYAMQHGPALPEVVSECLRSLTGMPVELVPGVVARHGESDHAVILVGLFDLLLAQEAGPLALDYLRDYLAGGKNLDALRYLALTMVAGGRPELVDAVCNAAHFEQRRPRIELFIQALSLLPPEPRIIDLLAQLEKRLAPR